jgi:hypothetical protein
VKNQNKMKRYPGTSPFTTADKDLFFGRQKEMAELYQLISLEQLVVLYGKSGLGKSSLIQAGIIPKVLEAETYQPISLRFTANNYTSTETPTEITKMALTKAFDAPTFLQKIKADENSLWAAAKNRQINGGGHQLVLFFDQFEELFGYPEAAIQTFMRELRELLGTAIPQRVRDKLNVLDDEFLTVAEEDIFYETLDIKAVFSIRSDRMHLMNKLARNLPQILANNYELQPLALADAKDAIVLPAAKEGDFDTQPFAYSDAALAKILAFLRDDETQRIEAFQLQLLCQTFEQKVAAEGLVVIHDVGDLENIIEAYFQNSISTLSQTDQILFQQLVAKELVSPDGNTRYSIFEQKLKTDYFISDELLSQLINLRLLRRENTNRGVIYEISHDTFLKPARAIKSNVEETEQAEALAKAEAEAREAQEREAIQRSLYEKAEKEKEEAEKQRKIAEEKTTAAKKAESKARRNLGTAVVIAIIALGIAFFAYLAKVEADEAKRNIIVNQAEAKAKELQNYAKSYKIYSKYEFAYKTYSNALDTLDKYEVKGNLYNDILKLKKDVGTIVKAKEILDTTTKQTQKEQCDTYSEVIKLLENIESYQKLDIYQETLNLKDQCDK